MDNYDHVNEDIMYISENIPAEYQDTQEYKQLLETVEVQITISCICSNSCIDTGCKCKVFSGCVNYVKTSNGLVLNANHLTDKSIPIIECNSYCSCSASCSNRLVQFGPSTNLYIEMCKKSSECSSKGFGLFTSKYIPKGSFICEYAGEILTYSQAVQRHNDNFKNRKMNYIFCLNEHCNGNIIQTIIDPSKFGNIGRYINHSCYPNCVILPVRVDSMIPKLAIFTVSDLNAGDEITFDYGPLGLHKENSDVEHRKKCHCYSENCRQFMPYDVY